MRPSFRGEVGVGVDEVCGAGVVIDGRVDDGDDARGGGAEERGLDANATGATEQVSDFRDHGARYEDCASGEMQGSEQVGAGAVVVVVAVGCGHERAGVADDHSGASDAVCQEIVVVAAEIVAAAGEGGEPGRWPFAFCPGIVLAAGFGEHGRDALVGKLFDEAFEFVALGAHGHQASRVAAGVWG